MSDIFLEELGVPAPDHMLGVGSASHAVQTARVTERIEPVLTEEHPDLVIDPGDVNSTLAATLVAVKLAIPVAHLESGLRSFDRTMPEEINRIVADEFSEYLFLHSEEPVSYPERKPKTPKRSFGAHPRGPSRLHGSGRGASCPAPERGAGTGAAAPSRVGHAWVSRGGWPIAHGR